MNQTYIVKKGDTLYGISNQFGVSVMDLSNLNNVNASSLQIGQILQIPNSSGTNPSNMFLYTVKKGDSLYSIASRYNTTVNEIVSLNNLTSNNLSIGQVLRIPEVYNSEMNLPNFKNYIVKKGDTLYAIARDNGITVDTIIKDNSLNNNNLSVGQILKIRIYDNSINNEYEECFGQDYIPEDSNNIIDYVVKRGDSLYSIASKYNTSVNELMRINNLNSINLSIGQILKIPSTNSSSNITYIVKKGDSLYSIAKKYNTTVNSIKRKNNLTTNNLSIGQKLVI